MPPSGECPRRIPPAAAMVIVLGMRNKHNTQLTFYLAIIVLFTSCFQELCNNPLFRTLMQQALLKGATERVVGDKLIDFFVSSDFWADKN
jgi:hypothetical protein